MRLAIISDIHGNLIALETVLADLKRERVDRIVCLGDVAFNGSQPREAIARVRELGCPLVMGNTDEWLLNPRPPGPNGQKDRRIVDMIEWGIAQLSADDLGFLRTFQPRVEVSLERGESLLCYHGSPLSNEDLILAALPDDELSRMLGGFRATVMAGGHTHTQMLRRYQGSVVITAGSVGMPLERGATREVSRHPPWSEYAVVTSGRENLGIELRRVPLDASAVVHAARASGMPHVESWAGEWLK